MNIPHRKYLLILAVLFGIWWIALGIHPVSRPTWLLENALVFVIIGFLAAYHRRLLFSRVSYTLIFAFLCLHQVGAHYTYSLVPYDEAFEKLTGRSPAELMCAIGFVNWRLRRDFAREWADSLRVKHKAPLGEDALARMQKQK